MAACWSKRIDAVPLTRDYIVDWERAYCVCMNEKMDNNESQSITQWEKSHPAERKACDAQAGWR